MKSSEVESLKFIDKVIIPYVQNEQKKLAQSYQEALLMMNVFRDQMINAVFEMLKKKVMLYR